MSVSTSLVYRIQLRKFSALNTGLFIAGLVAGGLLVKTVADPGNVIGAAGGPPGPRQ